MLGEISPMVTDITLIETEPETKIPNKILNHLRSKGLVYFVLRLYTTIKTYSNIYIIWVSSLE